MGISYCTSVSGWCVCLCVCVCGGERFTDKYTQPEKVTDWKGVGKTESGRIEEEDRQR